MHTGECNLIQNRDSEYKFQIFMVKDHVNATKEISEDTVVGAVAFPVVKLVKLRLYNRWMFVFIYSLNAIFCIRMQDQPLPTIALFHWR
mmetsp:Transcript_33651/g.54951  ORF Transcript_33651/g.54951 Transcript_33651/m.54951 type:complete len:89 (+) Transcript_33651:945-1211(+)